MRLLISNLRFVLSCFWCRAVNNIYLVVNVSMLAVYQRFTRAAGAKAKLLRANVQILGVKLPPPLLKIVKCCIFYKFCSFWNRGQCWWRKATLFALNFSVVL